MLRSKVVSSILFSSIRCLINNNGLMSRNLYAPAALGIDGFLQTRERIKMQVTNIDSFKSKMQEFVSDENSNNLVFTEDLKNMLHISEKPDLELLTQMIGKFCKQSREIRFGNYLFGPPIMRLLHHLEEPDMALKLFKDETTEQNGFFDQLITYQLLLDLLYNQGRYQDLLDTVDLIKSRQIQGGRYPRHVMVLALAACYKLNTTDSLDYASKLYREAISRGSFPMRRAVTFLAYLALKQSQPDVALEIVTNVKHQSYLTVRTIKALALAELKRFDDVIPILRAVLEIDNPMVNKQTFPVDSIEHLKKKFEGNTNKDLQADFEKVVSFLEKHGHILQQPLDGILCADIEQTSQYPGNSYQNDERRDNFSNNRGYERRDNYSNNRGYERRDNYSNREEYGQRDGQRGFQTREFDNPTGRGRRPGLHELN